MGEEANHEEESQVVSVPEYFEALLTDLVVCSCVHQEHNEKHEMACDATRLGIMDLLGGLLANLSALDVDKVDIVGGGMKHCPESHRVSDLTVEPDILICWEEPCQLGPDNSDDISKHWDENQAAVVSQNETSTTGSPDRPLQCVEASQLLISCLTPPSVGKETDMRTIE